MSIYCFTYKYEEFVVIKTKSGLNKVTKEHQILVIRNLPIDILVCSNSVKSDDHLIVVKPQAVYEFPFYKEQSVRIPDVNQIHHLFHQQFLPRHLQS